MSTLTIQLPFPPSFNHYWRQAGSRIIISASGRKYRNDVWCLVKSLNLTSKLQGKLSVDIFAYPPDERKRDVDNMLKAPLDALQKAGVYEDDNQIEKLLIERKRSSKPGLMIVTITEIEEDCQGGSRRDRRGVNF
jgi:crossover junction endodeoxyribonuclease RusA